MYVMLLCTKASFEYQHDGRGPCNHRRDGLAESHFEIVHSRAIQYESRSEQLIVHKGFACCVSKLNMLQISISPNQRSFRGLGERWW